MKPSNHLLCAHSISFFPSAHRHCGPDVRQALGNCRRSAMSSGVPRQLHVPTAVLFTPLVNTFYLLLQGWFACVPSASHSLVKKNLSNICLWSLFPFSLGASQVTQWLRIHLTLETCVQSLGQEEPLVDK